MARAALIALAAVAICGAASANRSSAAWLTHAGMQVRSAQSSCKTEVDIGVRHYRYARLPRNALPSGARLSRRADLQCEPELACRVSGGCALLPGHFIRAVAVRRLRGILPFFAVMDSASGHIYVNRKVFPVFSGGKRLLRLLRQRGGPQPDMKKAPPRASLLTTESMRFPLAMGNYCWSSASGDGTWVQACPLTVSPSRRFDIPLVVAEENAPLQLRLGFANPSFVRIDLVRKGKTYYSDSLSAAQTDTWNVAGSALGRSFLEIEAGRSSTGPTSQDWVTYLARLRVVATSGTG